MIYLQSTVYLDHMTVISDMAASGLTVSSIDDKGVGFQGLTTSEQATAQGILDRHINPVATEVAITKYPIVQKLVNELTAAGVRDIGLYIPATLPGNLIVHRHKDDGPLVKPVVTAHDSTPPAVLNVKIATQTIPADNAATAVFDLTGKPRATVDLVFQGALKINKTSVVLDASGNGSFVIGPYDVGFNTARNGVDIKCQYTNSSTSNLTCTIIVQQ